MSEQATRSFKRIILAGHNKSRLFNLKYIHKCTAKGPPKIKLTTHLPLLSSKEQTKPKMCVCCYASRAHMLVCLSE